MDPQSNTNSNNPEQPATFPPPTNDAASTSPSGSPSAFELFKPSIEAVRLNIGTLLFLVLPPTVYFLLLSLITGAMPHMLFMQNEQIADGSVGFSYFLLTLIGSALAIVFSAGLPYTLLKSVRHGTVTVREAFDVGLHFLWRFVGVTFISSLIVAAGLILFIVPGVIAIHRLLLAVYVLYDENLGIKDALKRSAELAKLHPGELWGVIGILAGLVLLSAIPYAGWLFTVVSFFYSAAPALRYQQIQAKSHETPQVTPTT